MLQLCPVAFSTGLAGGIQKIVEQETKKEGRKEGGEKEWESHRQQSTGVSSKSTLVVLVFVFVFSLLFFPFRSLESTRVAGQSIGVFFFFLEKLQYGGGEGDALVPFAAPHFLDDYCSLPRVESSIASSSDISPILVGT